MRTGTVCLVACVLAAVAADGFAQERRMGVQQPPEAVFDVPVDQVLPRLTGAERVGPNGRVGGELVFWGYRLADGTSAYFFVCALIEGVSCDARVRAICPSGTTVLERGEHAGSVVHRRCQHVAVAVPGELRPGCTDELRETKLAVGLAACN